MRNVLDAGLDQCLDELLGQLGVGRRQQFAGLGVDDVMRENLALEVLGRHDQLVDRRLVHVAHVLGRDAAAFLDDQLAAELDVEGRGLAAQALGHEAHLDVLLGQVEIVGIEEEVEHLFVRHFQRTQDDRHRQLAATVDTREHGVLRIELEVEPRAAVRDDARREQQLAGAVRLALVVIEEHARRAVQLRHDDALGAVDHEGAVIGHQRHLAEIDLLLTDVLDRLRRAARFLVVDDKADQYANRRRVGQAAHLAFLDVEYRLAQAIAHVLERRIARVADDREYRLERRVQTDVVAIFDRLVRLQELVVRVDLDRQQVRHVQDRRTLAEVLADALFLSE